MSSTNKDGIVPIEEIRKKQHFYRNINEERAKEQAISKIRQKQYMQIPELPQSGDTKQKLLEKWRDDDFNWRLISAIEKIEEYTRKGYDTSIADLGIAKEYGFRMLLTANASPTLLDFVEGGNANVPANSFIKIPMTRLRKLTLINEGTGRILFSTNEYDLNRIPTANLPKGIPYAVDPGSHRIEFCMVMAQDSDTMLTMIGEI